MEMGFDVENHVNEIETGLKIKTLGREIKKWCPAIPKLGSTVENRLSDTKTGPKMRK